MPLIRTRECRCRLMMIFLYNVAFVLFGLFYSPVFVLKMKQADSPWILFKERCGILSSGKQLVLNKQKNLWIHAVSVGEVMAAKKFIEGVTRNHPDFHLVVTTVTPTGQKIAKSLESDKVTVCYFPFDVTPAVVSFLNKIKPVCLFLMETEIWPNLLEAAWQRRVPVGLINARLSERSAVRYGRFPGIFRKLFEKLSFVLAQTQADADRFRRLGVASENLQVLGNMKFDNAMMSIRDSEGSARLKKEWGFLESDRILVGGSTHPGEEDILLRTFQTLKKKYSRLKLILAPRHIERSAEIYKAAKKLDIRAALSSRLTAGDGFEVLVLDQLGILKRLYAMADAAFVGGSLVQHGGQNPIEPAACQCPVFHGPYVFNFKQIYSELDQAEAAVLVHHEEELALKLDGFLDDSAKGSQMAQRAWDLVRNAQGATERHLEWARIFLAQQKQERTDNGIHTKLFPQVGGRL